MRALERVAHNAVTAALRVRLDAGIELDRALCPVDLAQSLGVKVAFHALPSLEGMYSPDGPTIVIGSLRPAGRRAFTCGHELGHHVLGHGLSVDELLSESAGADKSRDSREFAADRFSAALLMPKIAVMRAFSARGWTPSICTPAQAYVVAGNLGVGYSTLTRYMGSTLHLLTSQRAKELSEVPLPQIRKQLIPAIHQQSITVVDEHWSGRPVDLEVGAAALLPPGTQVRGDALSCAETLGDWILAEGLSPGSTTACLRGGALVKVRVARKRYQGLAVYRHLEEADED